MTLRKRNAKIKKMSRSELERVVKYVHNALFLDTDNKVREKEIGGADFIETVSVIFDNAGLYPDSDR